MREVGILDTPRANRTSVFEPFDFDRLCGQRLVQRGFLRLLLDIDGRLGRDLGAVGLVATILYVPLSLTGSADAISSSAVPSGNNRTAIRSSGITSWPSLYHLTSGRGLPLTFAVNFSGSPSSTLVATGNLSPKSSAGSLVRVNSAAAVASPTALVALAVYYTKPILTKMKL